MFILTEKQVQDIINGKINNVEQIKTNKVDTSSKENILVINENQDIINFINNSNGFKSCDSATVNIEMLGVCSQEVELEIDILEFIDEAGKENLSVKYYKCESSNDVYVELERRIDKYTMITVSFYLSDLDLYDNIQLEDKIIICNIMEGDI